MTRESTPPRDTVDTATRVFSRRDLAAAVQDDTGDAGVPGADGESAGAGGAGGDSGSAGAGAKGAAGNRDAAGAKGAAGDRDAAGPKDAAGERDSEAEDPKDAGDGGAAETGSGRNAGSGRGAGAKDVADRDGAEGEEGTEDDDVRAGAGGAGDAEGAASGTPGGRDGAATSGDDRLRAAVAAWVASADESEGSEEAEKPSAAQEEPDDRAKDHAEADAGPEDGSDGASERADAREADEAAEGSADGSDGASKVADAREADEAPTGAVQARETAKDAADDSPTTTDTDTDTDTDEPAEAVGKPADPRVRAETARADAEEAAERADAARTEADEAAERANATRTDADTADEAVSDSPTPHEPQAADDEDPPQGPPAVDDEGGGTKAEGGAKAVDQPTAVFKAVRPPKPPVDQPTTMLKAPAPKPAPEPAPKPEQPSDPERTSKFVALKPDLPDAARPDATRPVPQVGPERTTQQPLPPKPPLDLLAELTNTPPPPDTPVRTAIRRVKIWTPLVLLLAIVFAVVQAVRPLPTPTLDLTAEETYTFDGSKVDIPWPAAGQAALDVDGLGTFGSSGAQKPVPIASVAKVMTAYLILRDHPLKSGADGPKIKIDQAAEDQADAGQESTVPVNKGDSITQREALESILIASANNVARLLARWDAGSEKAFVQKMNDAAADLGMKNTTYTDPSGLHNTTVSTAVDQVKLAKAAMKEPAFREVAAMMSYDDYKGVNHSNWNQLVGHNNVVGIKTGTTTSALGNLVFAAKKEVGGETRTIVGAVIRQPAGGVDNTILSAALTAGDQLIRAAQGALKPATLLKKGDVVGYVDDGLGGRTPVVATKDVTAIGWAGLKVKLTFAYDDIPHTAKTGTKVGSLTVGDGTSGAVKIPVALEKELTEPGFTDKLTRLG